MTQRDKLEKQWAGLEPWKQDFGGGMERRGEDGYSWYDLSLLNALPCEKETAIIVTAWSGQLKWLRSTLESYRKTGAYVILSFDQHFFPWVIPTQVEMLRTLPNGRHYQLASSVVFKHMTADAGRRNGWFWDIRYAQSLLKGLPNIKYVYHTNGDCLWDKPEGLPDLLKLLDDCDLAAGQSTETTIHTAAVLYKAEVFHKVIDYMYELMRVPVIGSRSAEVLLKEAVTRLGLSYKHPDKQPLDRDNTVDMYARYNQDSTWKQLVGFRNLFAEYETAGNEGSEMMLFKPYVDKFYDWIYWSGEERETVCKYWESGDRRYLMQFWDRWEESDYNRLYYPLEHYGKEPILDGADKS